MLVFFGGQYFTTIAAFEAFKLCGWTQVSRSASILYSNYKLAKAASDKDDLVDDDNDGIADVKQITSKQLVERKVRLVLKTVDPNLVSEALTGTYVGVVGVIAALKIQFAGVVTLGASIADVFKHASDKMLRPVLEEVRL